LAVPQTPLEDLIAGLYRKFLHLEQVDLHDNFFDLGGDSLAMVKLSLEIERATGISLPMSRMFEAPTIHEIAKGLAGARPGAGYSPLVLLRPGVETPRIFMIPSLFGTVAELIPIVKALPGNLPVYGLQARGLDGIEQPDDRVDAMVDSYFDAVTSLQPRGPYFLVGKCFGGIVALELARRMLARGERIGLLAVLDSFPHPKFWPLRHKMRYFPIFLRVNDLAAKLRARPFREIPYNVSEWLTTARGRIARFVRREEYFVDGPPEWLHPAAKAVFQAASVAYEQCSPSYYPGKVDFLMCGYHAFAPGAHSALWRKWLGEYEEGCLRAEDAERESRRAESVASWLTDRIQHASR
jgi:acetoacetyl-CoA synthetase